MTSNHTGKELQSKKNLPKKWHGLKPSRFAKYRSWINSGSPGICGTYCSAVLVHDAVLQKYKKSLDKDTLLAGLLTVVDEFLPYKGTFFWDVQHGLKALLKDIPDWSVKSGLITEKSCRPCWTVRIRYRSSSERRGFSTVSTKTIG